MPTLYLIPVPLYDVDPKECLPKRNAQIIPSIKHFIVENVRSARRFLKATDGSIDIESLSFYELNKHTSPEEIASYLSPLKAGLDIGIISEAGCPAIADPGSDVVALAQAGGYHIEPLIGPSSIILSLMASGFNGQRFTFLGYLPIEESERAKAIREAEQRLTHLGETQIFIETPYRNVKLLEALIKHCKGSTKLCIASRLTAPDAFIKTKRLDHWQRSLPDLHKQPTIFLLGL